MDCIIVKNRIVKNIFTLFFKIILLTKGFLDRRPICEFVKISQLLSVISPCNGIRSFIGVGGNL